MMNASAAAGPFLPPASRDGTIQAVAPELRRHRPGSRASLGI